MKPNVIIIMADQLRADVLGRGFTSNIDSIRDSGIDFTRAYCASPLCVPARGAFFTGKYPGINGSVLNPWLPEDAGYGNVHKGITNLYRIMEKDWYSIHSGKQHLFTEGGKLEDIDNDTVWASTEKTYKEYLLSEGVRQPGGSYFKSYVPEMASGKTTRVVGYSNANTGCYDKDEKYYFDRYFAEKAIEAIKNRDRSKPLLLNAMFLAPHPPLEIPQPWYSKIGNDDFTLPDNVGIYYPYQSPLQMYNLTGVIGSKYKRDDWRESWRVYLGLVAMLDDCIGTIIDELKNEGIYDDSIIIFTSDHGEMLGSHSLFQKMCMYEESSHVPLFIRFPRNHEFTHICIDNVVNHIDVLPTLIDYLEIDHSGSFDGKSLMPLIRQQECDWDDTTYIQFDGNGARSNFQRAIVMYRYKLIIDYFKDECFFELYDVVSDKEEKDNLIFNPAFDETATELAAKLASHMAKMHDLLPCPVFDLVQFRNEHEAFKVPQL